VVKKWTEICNVAVPGTLFRIPDPNFSRPGSELFPSRILRHFNPKKLFVNSTKNDFFPYRIRIHNIRNTGAKIMVRFCTYQAARLEPLLVTTGLGQGEMAALHEALVVGKHMQVLHVHGYRQYHLPKLVGITYG